MVDLPVHVELAGKHGLRSAERRYAKFHSAKLRCGGLNFAAPFFGCQAGPGDACDSECIKGRCENGVCYLVASGAGCSEDERGTEWDECDGICWGIDGCGISLGNRVRTSDP